MTLGTLFIDLYLPDCRSLKEKRGLLKRLISRLRRDFNVSVAEVDKQDLHQSARLGVAIVCNDRSFANSVLSKVIEKVERDPSCQLQDHVLELL